MIDNLVLVTLSVGIITFKKMSAVLKTLKYGDIFDGEIQMLKVNCRAEKVDEDRWSSVRNVKIEPGEKWYYASLADAEWNKKDANTSAPVYLVKDDVGSDGWGGITIYRNIRLTGSTVPFLKDYHEMSW